MNLLCSSSFPGREGREGGNLHSASWTADEIYRLAFLIPTIFQATAIPIVFFFFPSYVVVVVVSQPDWIYNHNKTRTKKMY